MPPSPHVLDANTVGLWSLNETSGTSYADLGTINLPLVESTAGYVTKELAKFDNGLKFEVVKGSVYRGITTGATQAYRTLFLGTCTVEMWVKFNGPPADPAWGDVLFAYRGYSGTYPASNPILQFNRLATGEIKLSWMYGTSVGEFQQIVTPLTYGNGTWIHIACVKEVNGALTTARIYINGVQVVSAANLISATGATDPTVALTLGYPFQGADPSSYVLGVPDSLYNANATIDDIRISNVARTPAEIYFNATGNQLEAPQASRLIEPDTAGAAYGGPVGEVTFAAYTLGLLESVVPYGVQPGYLEVVVHVEDPLAGVTPPHAVDFHTLPGGNTGSGGNGNGFNSGVN